ncbi:MAG: hypothetical protein LBL60_01415 [Mycoplasmataceae bacterium]|nr:hypothetical protein [Mycoplasmataceae bacterium]
MEKDKFNRWFYVTAICCIIGGLFTMIMPAVVSGQWYAILIMPMLVGTTLIIVAGILFYLGITWNINNKYYY